MWRHCENSAADSLIILDKLQHTTLFNTIKLDSIKAIIMKSFLTPLHRKPLVISGPIAAGKSTLLKQILTRFGGNMELSVSSTTRKPKPSERKGVDYKFISQSEFKAKIAAKEMLEYNEVLDNYYGTEYAELKRINKKRKIIVLDVDIGGAFQIKQRGISFNSIYIMPPSMDELQRRLKSLNLYTDEEIEKNLRLGQLEIRRAKASHLFQHVIVNQELCKAYRELMDLVQSMYDFKQQKKMIQ